MESEESEPTPEPTPKKRKCKMKKIPKEKRRRSRTGRDSQEVDERDERIVDRVVQRLQQFMVQNRYVSASPEVDRRHGEHGKSRRSRSRSRGKFRNKGNGEKVRNDIMLSPSDITVYHDAIKPATEIDKGEKL